MELCTFFGDNRKTCLCDGATAGKSLLVIEVLGSFDELNSLLGLVRAFDEAGETKNYVKEVQNDIFTVCAEIASDGDKSHPSIKKEHIERIESLLGEVESKITIPKCFVIPGGTKLSSLLDYSRSIARRAERNLVRLSEERKVSRNLLKYSNRISGLLYALARLANRDNPEQKPSY
ncbi:cob(I)yrinic acid a,c-diamide adenosyltransferase [Candidatus Woesearchaeota archaeon]|nr:cob(I)yrinic acid a,c-diamide adenosyltransferase [Candidatus Woesearchaeota archaeon]